MQLRDENAIKSIQNCAISSDFKASVSHGQFSIILIPPTDILFHWMVGAIAIGCTGSAHR